MRGLLASRRALLAGTALAWATAGRAQPDLSRPAGSGLADKPSATHRFDRFEVDSADGRRRLRVQLALPRGTPPATGWPVLYLLDGNAAFEAVEAAQLSRLSEQGRPLALAAIGHANDQRFDVAARTLDYTPPAPPSEGDTDAERGRATGGADAFLTLIEGAIKPQVAARIAVDPARQSLWGHSYGGLFVLHTLLRRPDAFARYIAADPSLWWRQGFILSEEADAAPLPAAGVELLLMTGSAASGDEARPRPGVSPEAIARMRQARAAVPPDAARRFVERQSTRAGLHARYRMFEGVSHGPMLAASLPPALDLAAAPAVR
ncbi:alpha/beta hydrolase [Xylophilus sp. GOD-11R]|uniref:alpha/beta hydrolase n=1 Tax=Xylophilus sp. GOD-11R TaxID=3089814 RepID=UPI00298CC691|nr:alpha/beta hydrolase-fold protein [Xylophilus sp. GOD-11R]WPB56095.1 alpha/beta hydrolase-fold protein [Xylophilus sp. GOD-11R]